MEGPPDLLPEGSGAGPPLGWRAPFVVVALPTCALAVLAWYTIPEPKRGITEKALQVPPSPNSLFLPSFPAPLERMH